MKNRGRAGDELAYVIKTKIAAGQGVVKQGEIECFPLESWNAYFEVNITPSGKEHWLQPRESCKPLFFVSFGCKSVKKPPKSLKEEFAEVVKKPC